MKFISSYYKTGYISLRLYILTLEEIIADNEDVSYMMALELILYEFCYDQIRSMCVLGQLDRINNRIERTLK